MSVLVGPAGQVDAQDRQFLVRGSEDGPWVEIEDVYAVVRRSEGLSDLHCATPPDVEPPGHRLCAALAGRGQYASLRVREPGRDRWLQWNGARVAGYAVWPDGRTVITVHRRGHPQRPPIEPTTEETSIP